MTERVLECIQTFQQGKKIEGIRCLASLIATKLHVRELQYVDTVLHVLMQEGAEPELLVASLRMSFWCKEDLSNWLTLKEYTYSKLDVAGKPASVILRGL